MKTTPLDTALQFFEIARPIFVSLKEEARAASPQPRSRPSAKGLTFTQLRILLAIEYGKNQVGILARSGQVAQPAMSKIVDLLIRRGFVRRAPHESDRRKILLSLTAKGSAVTWQIRLKAAERYVAAIKALPHQEKERLAEGLAIISKVIQRSQKESQ
jgi:DNA-binding MarR family transcriptional regulator